MKESDQLEILWLANLPGLLAAKEFCRRYAGATWTEEGDAVVIHRSKAIFVNCSSNSALGFYSAHLLITGKFLY